MTGKNALFEKPVSEVIFTWKLWIMVALRLGIVAFCSSSIDSMGGYFHGRLAPKRHDLPGQAQLLIPRQRINTKLHQSSGKDGDSKNLSDIIEILEKAAIVENASAQQIVKESQDILMQLCRYPAEFSRGLSELSAFMTENNKMIPIEILDILLPALYKTGQQDNQLENGKLFRESLFRIGFLYHEAKPMTQSLLRVALEHLALKAFGKPGQQDPDGMVAPTEKRSFALAVQVFEGLVSCFEPELVVKAGVIPDMKQARKSIYSLGFDGLRNKYLQSRIGVTHDVPDYSRWESLEAEAKFFLQVDPCEDLAFQDLQYGEVRSIVKEFRIHKSRLEFLAKHSSTEQHYFFLKAHITKKFVDLGREIQIIAILD